MREILSDLERLRSKSRVFLTIESLSTVLAWALAIGLLLIFADFLVRFPRGLRFALMLGAAGGLLYGCTRVILPALAFRPTLTQLALRLEASLPALRGRLASSVEFAMEGVDDRNPLAARSVRDATQRLDGESVRRMVRTGPAVRDTFILFVLAGAAAFLAINYPAAARTGVTRLVAPWSDAHWPARTAVRSRMADVLEHDGVHPRGHVLVLRAENQTPDEPDGRVEVTYRTQSDGKTSIWQTVALTHQSGAIHERLIDTEIDGVELYFETDDARTATERITIVPSPAAISANLQVVAPAYAASRRAELLADLGTGLDARGVTEEASLVGSSVTMTIDFNKPVIVPENEAAPERDRWLRESLQWPGETVPDLEVVAPHRWILTWTLDASTRVEISVRDEHGLVNDEPIIYEVRAIEDQLPTVTLTEPGSDRSVLPTAVIEVVAEANDDIAVERLTIEGAVRPAESDALVGLDLAVESRGDRPTATVKTDLDLSDFDLVIGDVIQLTAVATETAPSAEDAVTHEVRSVVRTLRIISELDLAAELRRQLSAVRQNAIRTELQQAELQDDVRDHGVKPGLRRAQARIGERIAAQRETIDDLAARMGENRFDDAQLEELMTRVSDLLDYAGRAANAAADAIEEGTGQAADDPARADDPETTASISEAQQDVRDELSDLIELLDRDEDTWLVQRQLESLQEAQSKLQEDTEKLAQETIGQDREDLSPANLSELERIVQRQRDLRDQARRLIEEMRRRADALEPVDPQAASGMRVAAETGEKRELDRDMDNASQRAEENQLQSAAAAQAAAQDTLNRMNEDLQETSRARAEELLRQIASLIESIERLVVLQETEIIGLAQSAEDLDLPVRDRAMVRLSQNTRAVAIEARSVGQAARRVGRELDRAADAQGEAVTALRERPVDMPGAGAAENAALERLREALELAKALEAKTQEEQTNERRTELIDRYREFAELQTVLREDTKPLADIEKLSRRQRTRAAALGGRQEGIRTGLDELRTKSDDLSGSDVFIYVHDLMDAWATEVVEALNGGRVNDDVLDLQRLIADSITRQIEALEESAAPPEEFVGNGAEGGPGGAGGGQPSAVIPPVAEVKRLHGLQEQVYNQTKRLDAREDLDAGAKRQRVRKVGEMQRDLVELGEKLVEEMSDPSNPVVTPQEDGDFSGEEADDEGAETPESSSPADEVPENEPAHG